MACTGVFKKRLKSVQIRFKAVLKEILKTVMSQQEKHFYEFGEFRIDVAKRRLLRAGEIVPLTPKAFDLLLVLVERSGQTVEKEELMQRLWPDTIVEESNLSQNVYTLRKIFGERRNESRYIATVSGIGYRFVAEVRLVPFANEAVTIREKTETRVTITETTDDEEYAVPLLTAAAKPHTAYKKIIGGLLALVVVLLAYIGWQYRRQSQTTTAFHPPTIRKLTNTGTARGAAISPDGKHVDYIVVEGNRQSLWQRQLATDSTQQIVPPEESLYLSLSFSRDGDYLYFVKRKANEAKNALYQMPALGGVPARLVENVEAFFALSFDGRSLAYVRNAAGTSALLIAQADGGAEHQLAARPISDFFKVPAWSPDGKLIACTTGDANAQGKQNTVVGVRVADGALLPLTERKWSWTRWAEWLPDGSGLLVTGRDDPETIQIWHVAYPTGQVRQVTQGSDPYFNLSLTADAQWMAASQAHFQSELWLAAADGRGAARKLTYGTGGYGEVCFMPDGRILYTSTENGNQDVWRVNADGSDRQRLTTDAKNDLEPAMSPDGRTIVFVSDRAGHLNVWRMQSDGSEPARLTHGEQERYPAFTPDGQWIVYLSSQLGEPDGTLWKIPLAGGAPVRVAERANRFSLAPDGQSIAYLRTSGLAQRRIVLLSLAGASPERILDLPPEQTVHRYLRWAADSRALYCVFEQQGFSDIWRQPLDGSPPQRITHLNVEGGLLFDFSPDGKRLVLSRQLWTSDLLLLSNFR